MPPFLSIRPIIALFNYILGLTHTPIHARPSHITLSDQGATWSGRHGDRIYYEQNSDLFERAIDLSSDPKRVATGSIGRYSVRGDGNSLIISKGITDEKRLYSVSISTGDENLIGPSDTRIGQSSVSPDNRFVAAIKEISGNPRPIVFEYQNGTYVQVADEDAAFPVWSPSGDRLYYASGETIRAVDLDIGDSVQPAGRPYTVFEHEDLRPQFDVLPDGRLALLLLPIGGFQAETGRVIQNWGDHLRSLAEESN